MRLAFGSTEAADPALAGHTVAEGLAGGKFENLNRVLAAAAPTDFDWLLVVDDDVRLPPRFLDRFVAVCERFELDLAQPAQSQRSHSAWRVTRRRPASLVRETRFVEIGPLTAFGRRAAAELLPFPELRFGWGLDLHWAALAAERGWRLGVVDATPVRHESATVGSAYRTEDARAEAAELPRRPSLPARRARGRRARHPPADGPLMRLLFVAPDMHRGGAERHWATLIPALARRGAEVAAALPQRRGPALRRGARGRRAGDLRCTWAAAPTPPALRRALAEAGARPGRRGHARREPAAGRRGDRPPRRRRPRAQRAHAAHARAASCSPRARTSWRSRGWSRRAWTA